MKKVYSINNIYYFYKVDRESVENFVNKTFSLDTVPIINREFISILKSVSEYECIGDISSQFKR